MNGKLDCPTGCIAAGTLIKMADDSCRPIETIRPGDLVSSEKPGQPLRIIDVLRGREEKLVRISDGNGHTILLTAAHPVQCQSGVKTAGEIKDNDELTVDGTLHRVVTSQVHFQTKLNADRPQHTKPTPEIPEPPMVYSLRVDGSVGDSWFIANGFVVGDFDTQ